MSRRVIVRVYWGKHCKWWSFKRPEVHPDYGERLFEMRPTRRKAVALAAEACRDFMANGGLAELIVINRSDGRISERRTYGRDPRRSRG